MGFLTDTSLSQLQFYLGTCRGQVGVCCNQAVPKSVFKKSGFDVFYSYQNQLVKQELDNIFVQGNLQNLPFLTDSIDAFVLWHNLDTEPEPKQVIRELYRCLAPNGVILMIGANTPCLFKSDKVHGSVNKTAYLSRILLHHGFNIEVQKTLGFRPDIKNKMLFKALKPLEVIGQFCWPMLGTNYFMLARKPVLGATPLVAASKRVHFKNLKGIAEPSRFKFK